MIALHEFVLVLVVWGNPIATSHQLFRTHEACVQAGRALVREANRANPQVRHQYGCYPVDPD